MNAACRGRPATRLTRLKAHALRAALVLVGAVAHAATPAPAPSAAASPLSRLTHVECPNFDAMKAHYTSDFANRMTSWSLRELADAGSRPVLYLFSGPDIVTAMALFPSAKHLTLVADQKPELEQLESASADDPGRQARECNMLSYFAHRGYYRTNDLNGLGGSKPRFIKLLAYSLAFGGATVTDAQVLAVAADGALVARAPGTPGPAQGVRFSGTRADGSALTVDYLTIDLSDHGLGPDPAARAYLQKNARDVLFLKSASHLLQSPHFAKLAELLLSPPAPIVVQDETGFGIDRLHGAYTLSLYGHFSAPQRLWAASPSAKALVAEYKAHPSTGELPFTIGYEKASGSALLVGRRQSP